MYGDLFQSIELLKGNIRTVFSQMEDLQILWLAVGKWGLRCVGRRKLCDSVGDGIQDGFVFGVQNTVHRAVRFVARVNRDPGHVAPAVKCMSGVTRIL